MNESLRNRMMGSRNAQYRAMGVNTGLDPSLPGFDPTAGPLGPVTYDPLLGAPGMPRLSQPMSQGEVTAYNESNRPRVDEGILQRVIRRMQGGPVPQAPQPNQAGALAGTMIAQAAPQAAPVDQGSPYVGGPIPFSAPMADARAQEIAYANSMKPQAGSMEAARAQEIAYANSQPNPAARGGSGGGSGVPMPPPRPAEFGSQPALYSVDFGDGSPVRQYLAKDGKAPNIPGANVYLDQSYDPNAGALAKFIRGVF